jgi:hypothetical protein
LPCLAHPTINPPRRVFCWVKKASSKVREAKALRPPRQTC